MTKYFPIKKQNKTKKKKDAEAGDLGVLPTGKASTVEIETAFNCLGDIGSSRPG